MIAFAWVTEFTRSDCGLHLTLLRDPWIRSNRAKRKRPGLNRVTVRSVDQSSPENCSPTPYVLIRIGAIAHRNGILVIQSRSPTTFRIA